MWPTQKRTRQTKWAAELAEKNVWSNAWQKHSFVEIALFFEFQRAKWGAAQWQSAYRLGNTSNK